MSDKYDFLHNEEMLSVLKDIRDTHAPNTELMKHITMVKGEKGDKGSSITNIHTKDLGDTAEVSIEFNDRDPVSFTLEKLHGIDGKDGKDGLDGINGKNGLDGKAGAMGERGPAGPIGKAGKSGKDGRSLTWRGTFSVNTEYNVDDIVEYGGSSYICVKENKGASPTNNQIWNLVAKRGQNGANGAGGSGSGSMTANEILTAIKTVDGTGSGLDADTLDGNDATAFATTAAVAAGYQPLDADLTALAALTDPATKLSEIETGADVTDTANVTAAGALMDSEVSNLAAVKAFDPTDYATAAQGALADSATQPADLVASNIDTSSATVSTISGADAETMFESVDANLSGLQTAIDGKGQVNTIVEGTGVTVDASDPANPIVSATGGAAWGDLTGTLSDQTDLQAALDLKASDSRVDTVSNFASPNAGGVVTGQYYDNSFQGTASSTLAGAANQIDLAPYYTSVDLPIDQIGIAVSTAVASSFCKVVIYDSNSSGWPNNLLYETGNLDCGTTGYKSEALTFTFSRGTQYWVGVRKSSTATLRTINVSSAVNLGLTSSTAANYATILRRTVTYANAAPDPWVFTNSDRTANVTPPSIRFRAA